MLLLLLLLCVLYAARFAWLVDQFCFVSFAICCMFEDSWRPEIHY